MYTDPALALGLFALLSTLCLAAFWPRVGVAARLRRLRRATERVRVEDALKYLFHRGAEGTDVTPDALAGALQVRQAVARDLLDRLTDRGLAERHGPLGHRLTAVGRTEALRIVRSHRLLEHYLADRTGIGPEEWHEVAEDEEHLLTPEEVERLAERLGQPRFDPHGDPIPTATGELPVTTDLPLPTLPPGDGGTIVHLEDEPTDAYDRLVAQGFALGKSVVVRSRTPTMTALVLDGRELAIPRAFEPAVSIERAEVAHGPVRTLADLAMGEVGRVRRLSSDCRGAQRRRLLDLGVVPGTRIVGEMRSAGGDPIAYRIRGALIALRRHQAAWIEVEPAAEDGAAADAAIGGAPAGAA
ncbi:MAG: FeoA domain-containing protein [Gemmatimonadaceae bacterium]|nr:FeoA domain-containing protein [Gemmatimonadaceae bacterium]